MQNSVFMRLTAERLLLADPATDIITTSCKRFTQHHDDVIMYMDIIDHRKLITYIVIGNTAQKIHCTLLRCRRA